MVLKLGELEVHPFKTKKNGFTPDLLRLEAYDKNFIGHSQDIPLNKTTRLRLIEGKYILASYGYEDKALSKRSRIAKIISIRHGKKTSIKPGQT